MQLFQVAPGDMVKTHTQTGPPHKSLLVPPMQKERFGTAPAKLHLITSKGNGVLRGTGWQQTMETALSVHSTMRPTDKG